MPNPASVGIAGFGAAGGGRGFGGPFCSAKIGLLMFTLSVV